MLRLTIDLNTEGDVGYVFNHLNEKGGKSILAYAETLGIVHVEEQLDGAKLKVAGANIHQCDANACQSCHQMTYRTIQSCNEDIDPQQYHVPEQ